MSVKPSACKKQNRTESEVFIELVPAVTLIELVHDLLQVITNNLEKSSTCLEDSFNREDKNKFSIYKTLFIVIIYG